MEQVFGAELLLIAMRSQDLPLHLPALGRTHPQMLTWWLVVFD